jgi:ActR/RegA family two-component response regulator
MVVKSSNLSGSSLMVVEETCTYTQCPLAPAAATHYKQEARITAFLPFLAGRFESYSFASLQSKSKEGMAVVEKLCQRIQTHGALSLLGFGPTATAAAAVPATVAAAAGATL